MKFIVYWEILCKPYTSTLMSSEISYNLLCPVKYKHNNFVHKPLHSPVFQPNFVSQMDHQLLDSKHNHQH